MDTVRDDFPIFTKRPGMVYLDSAATSLKPSAVISRLEEYSTQYSSNIHRGLYPIADKANTMYEDVRETVKGYINASHSGEIIFTKGATEGLNLIASCLSRTVVRSGARVLTTIIEHHANFIPWQEVSRAHGSAFDVVKLNPLHDTQDSIVEAVVSRVTRDTCILALTHASNALGIVLPVSAIVHRARSISPQLIVVLDVSQSIQHIPVDVQELDVDLLAFSGHKCFGPTGSGVVYGKQRILESLPPYQYGGDMIEEVSVESTTYAHPPHRFEAGTPPIAQIIGMGEAIGYLKRVGLGAIHTHDSTLRQYALDRMRSVFDQDIVICDNPHLDNVGILAFNLRGVHAHDVAQVLAEHDVCVRAGHHCAQPLHTHLGLDASCRVSLAIYNTQADIDRLCEVLEHTRVMFA